MQTKVVLDVASVHSEMINARITKKELAKRMGIARGTLDGYLNHPDKVPLKAISRMASALNQPYVKDFIREVEA